MSAPRRRGWSPPARKESPGSRSCSRPPPLPRPPPRRRRQRRSLIERRSEKRLRCKAMATAQDMLKKAERAEAGGQHTEAGALFERCGEIEKAISAYKKGG